MNENEGTMKDIREAAEYLNMSERAFRHHVDKREVVADERGKYGKRLFKVATLDRFRRVKRPQGRPRVKHDECTQASPPSAFGRN